MLKRQPAATLLQITLYFNTPSLHGTVQNKVLHTMACNTVCNNRKSDANYHFSYQSKLHNLPYISCPHIFQERVALSISEGLGCCLDSLALPGKGSQSSRSPVITSVTTWQSPAYFSHLLCNKLCIHWPVQFFLFCEKVWHHLKHLWGNWHDPSIWSMWSTPAMFILYCSAIIGFSISW